MIISCPECAGPFEVPDDRIAALVQVACPHCAFRMILDFGAANDPGLVEQGMRIASGFRSAADYHASLQVEAEPAAAEATTGEPIAVEPEMPPVRPARTVEEAPALVAEAPMQARREPAEPPVRVRPERVARAEPPVRARPERIAPAEPPVRVRPEPVSPAASPPRPLAPTPVREPVRPAAEARPEPSDEARTEVHMLPRGAELRTPVDVPPVRRRPGVRTDEGDIAVTVPTPATEIARPIAQPTTAPDEVAIDMDDEDERAAAQAHARAAERAAHPAFGSDEDEDVPTRVVSPEARDVARREMEALAARRGEADGASSGRERVPPHTPPGRAKVAARDDDAATQAERSGGRSARRVEVDEELDTASKRKPVELDDDDEFGPERMSTFGVIVLVLLLLLAGGLIGASIALNDDHSPDPRPLLETLYRRHIKGETPAPAPAPSEAEGQPEPAAPTGKQ